MVLGHDIRQTRRTRDVQISFNITFDTMLLNPETLLGLKTSGFYKPSPIQLHGIPLGKCGFDLLLEAKSGTGKTAVFAVVALEKIDLRKGLQVVILAPTREIAAQICDVIKQIGSSYKGLQVEVVMGGLPVEDDIEKFKRNVHIVVASPGRLNHLIKDKHVDISRVRLLVLDEADKLVEKSFQEDVKYIFSCLPTQKQVIMSSATYTGSAKTFIMNYVQNAQHVRPDSNCVLLGVDQKMSIVKYNSNIVKQTQHRLQEVLKIFSKVQFKQCLIFCNYQVRVSEVHKLLLRAKWPSEQLYGNQDQTDRLEALKTLQEYKCRILIATDLAARGIDASNIDLVINFEPPFEWQTYLHRIGRAGRYGSYGMAITILSEGAESNKFHTMLEPMKETINITDLWCNDEITFDKDVISRNLQNNDEKFEILYKSKEIIQETQELWKMLTCENMEGFSNLESFEHLCASFNNSSTDIKTFDEILKSFDSHLHKDEDLSFTHIDINDEHSRGIWVSLKKYLSIISEKYLHVNGENDNNNLTCVVNTDKKWCQSENKNKFQSEANQDDAKSSKYSTESENEYNSNDENFNNSVPNIKESHTHTQESHRLDQEEPNRKEEEQEGYIIHNDVDINNSKVIYRNKCSKKSIEINVSDSPYDTEKALLAAGLPTAFGKSKKHGNSPVYAKQKKTNKLISKTRDSKQLPLTAPNIETSSCTSSRANDNSHIQFKSKRNFGEISKLNTMSYPKKSCNVNKQKTGKCKLRKSDNPEARLETYSEYYANWYKQLKLHTKQIELAMYMDELSKL